jgi:hypothetical protein
VQLWREERSAAAVYKLIQRLRGISTKGPIVTLAITPVSGTVS